jgi:hypothetical protein
MHCPGRAAPEAGAQHMMVSRLIWTTLAKSPALRGSCICRDGGRTRARTWDPLIKSQLLYQLSYAPERAMP